MRVSWLIEWANRRPWQSQRPHSATVQTHHSLLGARDEMHLIQKHVHQCDMRMPAYMLEKTLASLSHGTWHTARAVQPDVLRLGQSDRSACPKPAQSDIP